MGLTIVNPNDLSTDVKNGLVVKSELEYSLTCRFSNHGTMNIFRQTRQCPSGVGGL